VYKEGALTGEKMREAAISWKDVFDEIPINVHSSPLATALLHTIQPNTIADGRDFARLDLSVGPLLEKNLEFLNDCLDDVVSEQQKVEISTMPVFASHPDLLMCRSCQSVCVESC